VKWPAIGLISTSLLSPFILGVVVATGHLKAGSWMLVPLILQLGLITVAALGAYKLLHLESRSMAIVGGIAGCGASFFNFLCLPFAVWSLAVASRRDVRDAFDRVQSTPPPAWPRTEQRGGGWKFAALGAGLVITLLGILVGLAVLYHSSKTRAAGRVLSEPFRYLQAEDSEASGSLALDQARSQSVTRLESLSEADRSQALALFNDIEDFGHEFEAAFTARNLAAAQTGTRRLMTALSEFNAVVRGTGCEFPAALLNDVAKVREVLAGGDWEKARQVSRFNEAYSQEFKRIASRMRALGRQQKRSPAAVFGPVVEKVIAGEGDVNKRFIDLDTGKQLAAAEFFGSKAEPSPEETQKWWKETGVDAMGDTSGHVRGLVGFDMVAAPVPNEEWDRLPPSQLNYYLTMSAPGTPVTMSARDELPLTFAFKTREGGQGLLQIVGIITNNPPSLKVRYKLTQQGKAAD
jgi:hypothetical protein